MVASSANWRAEMSFAKIHGHLTSRIGRPVNFGPPQDVLQKGGSGGAGTIIDEVWADQAINTAPVHEQLCGNWCWGDYSFCSQMIEWDDGRRMIRLAYYRRRCGEDFWTFASQMTVTSEPETIKALLDRTLSRRNWFE